MVCVGVEYGVDRHNKSAPPTTVCPSSYGPVAQLMTSLEEEDEPAITCATVCHSSFGSPFIDRIVSVKITE